MFPMRKVLSVLLVVAFTITGCSEAFEKPEEPSVFAQAQTAQECDSSPSYADDCMAVELQEAVTWQQTVEEGNPAWRDITQNENGTPVVNIDSLKLNAGLIPVEDGQGHYSSKSDLLNTITNLLGVQKEKRFILKVEGATAKINANRDDISRNSWGNFILDAITDESGQIYINGKNRTDDLQAGELYAPLPVDDNRNNTTQTNVQPVEEFGDDNTSAVVNAYKANGFAFLWSGMFTNQFKRYGKGTRLKVFLKFGFVPWVKRIIVHPETIQADLTLYDDKLGRSEMEKSDDDANVAVGEFYACAGCNASEYIRDDAQCGTGYYKDKPSKTGESASDDDGGGDTSRCSF